MMGCASLKRRINVFWNGMPHLRDRRARPSRAILSLTISSWKTNNREHINLYLRNMDFADLQVFKAVVEEGGISPAARKLHRVQSNVSTRIRQLEASLGTPLFVREKRRLFLSPAGKLFLDYVRQLLRISEQARTAIQGDAPRGVLRIGTLE